MTVLRRKTATKINKTKKQKQKQAKLTHYQTYSNDLIFKTLTLPLASNTATIF